MPLSDPRFVVTRIDQLIGAIEHVAETLRLGGHDNSKILESIDLLKDAQLNIKAEYKIRD